MRRGFTLVLVLMVSLILLVLGMGFLSKKASQYAGARAVEEAAQARALALAGLEDARVRLAKDLKFPPPADVDQLVFEYSEIQYDLDGVTPIGCCVVKIDSTYAQEPYFLLRIQSTGLVGPADKPKARRRLIAELDLSPVVRGSAVPNPGYFKVLNWIDPGTY